MDAKAANFLDFLHKSPQFTIPIYQRNYSWTEKQCRQLWDDIIRAGTHHNISAHFVGAIVYIQEGLYQVTHQSSLQVIDGQQRLTTILLLLEALARHIGDDEPIAGFSAQKLRHYYLLNHLEKDIKKYKLLLNETDKSTLLALMGQKPLPAPASARIQENFDFVTSQIEDLGDTLEALCKGLTKLMLVYISLDRQKDNPQLIFESMNSTGLDLSQADLIRNFVLMDLEPNQQRELYTEHWRPMEQAFGQAAYEKRFDSFMRHYLTLKIGRIPKVNQVYEEFKSFTQQHGTTSIQTLVADIHKFAGYYCSIALGKESNRMLLRAFRELSLLKVGVAYPFLLQLYDDFAGNKLTDEELIKAVRLIESYIFRRAVCSIPTNSLNKTFSTFGQSLDKSQYLDSIQAHFLQLPSYRRFPNDDEFQREFKVRDLYNFGYGSYWLQRVENHDRKEPIPTNEYTIEHILPQNQDLSDDWKCSLGDDWQRVQDTYLHTLGNLTLTGYNSEYSDHPFYKKRDIEGGFRESPLRVNRGLGQVVDWNEAAILQRADDLANVALSVWCFPSKEASRLITDIGQAVSNRLAPFRESVLPPESEGPSSVLFTELRKHVLALDPCVSEVIFDGRITYRAEEDVVSVGFQGASLSLWLNLQFHELYEGDPRPSDDLYVREMLNGDVEIGLVGLGGIPYTMGLVRQVLEAQLGHGSEK